jgi:hypothetical protein
MTLIEERDAAKLAAPADRRRILLRIALLVSTLAMLFGPGLVEHARYAADPWRFNDDARQQIWPFLRDVDPALFPNDYTADYFLAAEPRGFRVLYRLGAAVADPRTLSKLLPFVELPVVLYCLIASGWQLGGAAAAWATGALSLSADFYLWRMSGGLPRSFAFPLTAAAVLAVVRGKPWRLCILVMLGSAFYFPAVPILGFVTAAYLGLLPPSWQGDARTWSWRRRAGTLAATAFAAALVATPAIVAGRAYGPLIGRGDIAAYPEAWLGGRYAGADLPLNDRLTATALHYAKVPIFSRGPSWSWKWRDPVRQAVVGNKILPKLGWAALLLGSALLLVKDVAARRLASVVAGAFASYAVSFALWPWLYVPVRSLTYTLPLLAPVVLPASLASLADSWRVTRSPYVRGALVVGSVLAIVVTFGARGPGRAGIDIDVPPKLRPLYEQIARLPPASLIAGWPEGVMDNVPYVSARKILVGFEIHQAYHERYVREMRRRMEAFIDAYFSTDIGPLRRLRDDFGVTHLLVDRDHYLGEPPHYFKPFDTMVESAARRLQGRPETLRQVPASAVIEVGRFVVLDLSRVGAE